VFIAKNAAIAPNTKTISADRLTASDLKTRPVVKIIAPTIGK